MVAAAPLPVLGGLNVCGHEVPIHQEAYRSLGDFGVGRDGGDDGDGASRVAET